eukprot:scaffold275294_cov19-Prasinocladus_malaysianus.AAC.1
MMLSLSWSALPADSDTPLWKLNKLRWRCCDMLSDSARLRNGMPLIAGRGKNKGPLIKVAKLPADHQVVSLVHRLVQD